MYHLRRIGSVSNALKSPITPLKRSLPSLRSNFLRQRFPTSKSSHWQMPCCSITTVSNPPNDLFNYTSGRWLVNEDLRLAERRREFDVKELCKLAAQSVGRSFEDINTFVKLAEGGFNRTFLITMRDGFEMVARIPYPATIPKFYAVASEVATMRYLRSSGLPVPEVYGYNPSPDNAAQTEYIFMEFIRGTKLSDIWMDLEEPEIASVLRQVVQLESKLMSISFPAGGSLYYADDLKQLAGQTRVALKDERFCVGPDVRVHMWYGRRSRLDVNRGPYESAEAAMIPTAQKELAYLEQFGQPLLPFQRERRESHEYKVQSPSDHIENLNRYLLIASSLIPENPALRPFRMRHPDLQHGNIIVSKSSDSNELQIAGLLDWQHAVILPLFLTVGIPSRLQNYGDPISQRLIPPAEALPENMDELDEEKRNQVMGLYNLRLGHFHYVKNTEKHNKLHYDALSDPKAMFLARLFYHSGCPWEGETHALKSTLIDVTEMWEMLKGAGIPCPVAFDSEDLRQTKELAARLQVANENLEALSTIIGFEPPEAWVPNENYEMVLENSKTVKKRLFEMCPEEARAQAAANWFLDDMDEEDYQ